MTDEPAEAAVAADGYRHLDPRALPFQRTVAAIVSAVLAVGTAVGAVATAAANYESPAVVAIIGLGWFLGNGLLAWHGQRWQAIDYAHTTYRVDDEGLEIRRGVFWREVVNVPRSRVQHTDVSQGPLERKYGLGTLVVYTAGTEHAKVTLGGLDHAMALGIRQHLMPERGTDAV